MVLYGLLANVWINVGRLGINSKLFDLKIFPTTLADLPRNIDRANKRSVHSIGPL